MSAADIAQQDTLDMTTPLNPDAKKLFAGFGRRMVSVYFDVLIAVLLMQAVPVHIMEALDPDISDFQEPYIAVLVLYFAAFWASPMRATPAQFLLGVRVVNESGNTLSLGRAIARSMLLIGLMVAAMMLFSFPTTVSLGIVSLLAYVLLFSCGADTQPSGGARLARSVARRQRERIAIFGTPNISERSCIGRHSRFRQAAVVIGNQQCQRRVVGRSHVGNSSDCHVHRFPSVTHEGYAISDNLCSERG